MATTCGRCHERPGTAGPNPLNPRMNLCIRCASIDRVDIPITAERRNNVPDSIVNGPAWAITKDIRSEDDSSLWLHQANALQELEAGNNTVIATPTASGKSMIFQLRTLSELAINTDATALVFYPTKALANDQANSWNRRCADIGMPPETVDQINGDVPMNRREDIISRSRIIIMTPDVCHAWLARKAQDTPIRNFLKNLKVIIIDEAHTYESIFGSNSAYLFRRLITLSAASGNPNTPQFIAATATILEPEAHLEKLTGQKFIVVDESQNGAPRFSRSLYHLPYGPQRRGSSPAHQMAELVISIIDNDPDAQVIAFHDSRQGIERIVQNINRPDIIMPYRSGYLPEDRLDIETKLREGKIRGVITTSALELGIDMPDLNYGINLDLPTTRKSFHQRLGRVGRSMPGTFIILAPGNRFSDYGETIQDYYNNSVEPSLLYLDNEYISYQQARCLKSELESSRRETRTLPKHCVWPVGFDTSLKNAHGKPPPHLSNININTDGQPPQLAHSIRSSGEEDLKIVPSTEDVNKNYNGRGIGSISLSAALREAYPGAIYLHRGTTYTIDEWVRNPQNRQGIIKAAPRARSYERTHPLTRYMATLEPDDRHINKKMEIAGGYVHEIMVKINQSVEGFRTGDGQGIYYEALRKNDPRKTRKQREFPTSAVHIQIPEEWFSGDTGWPWQTRHQISNALRLHLAYQKSIPLPELGSMVENIVIKTEMGYLLSLNSVLVYDNINGGIGLVQHLYDDLPGYAQRLLPKEEDQQENWQSEEESSEHSQAMVYPESARNFVRWLENRGDEVERPPEPSRNDWWRVVKNRSEVSVFSSQRDDMAQGTVMNRHWDEGIKYQVSIGQEWVNLDDDSIKQANPNFDYELWHPESDQTQELHVDQEGR